MNLSVKMETPIEFLNITSINPLISRCQIKVCWVGDTPNRNGSVITKEVATEMANSLPGSPIVGYYNQANGDFEEHNRLIDVSNGKFEIIDTTRPYGFVDLNAKVWFQEFRDYDNVVREYLMTEGYLWTGQYPECQRIIDKGNNQSMELDEETLDGSWTKRKNEKFEFFIINEAIISKLCVLGENNEPCFEGSQITAPIIQFSLGEGFKEQLFSMIKELKEILNEGGANKVFNKYSVNNGDTLWNALYSYVEQTYSDASKEFYSIYRIDGIYEEENQKFAVLQHRTDGTYFRLNFSFEEETLEVNDILVEITSNYSAEEPQFISEEVENYENEYAEKKNSDKKEKDDSNKTEDKTEEPEKCPDCGKPVDECECHKEEKKKYNLDEIQEYVELSNNYADLEAKFNALVEENNALKADIETIHGDKANLETELNGLNEFKLEVDRNKKQEMINSFYMLSDEDKEDVITNIDTYSLDDIEAKLSVICVRNKVSFNLEEDNNNKQQPTTFNLGDGEDDSTPAWVKRVMAVAKEMK